MTVVDHVFLGALRPLPPEGQQTGIYKQPAEGQVRVEHEGIVGDHQGDRRVHGGPEKALHLFPADHHATLAWARPELAPILAPGVLGENLSTRGLLESDVCVGDVYALGSATIQVSQPRRPCWKIDNRLASPGANRLLVEHGCPGWYFRVLQPGTITAGDELDLIERLSPGLTLSGLLAIDREHRPDPERAMAYAAAPGLNPDWAARLRRRADWLSAR
ncbi:MOSC domain-containing protein [Mariniluteicoccus endophyticus]